jgi:hypothetical protein
VIGPSKVRSLSEPLAFGMGTDVFPPSRLISRLFAASSQRTTSLRQNVGSPRSFLMRTRVHVPLGAVPEMVTGTPTWLIMGSS